MTVKFPLPKAVLSQHVIALGKTRSGKSSKMRLIVEHILDQKTPVCIIDPKGDWWGLKSSADGKKAGYPIIIFGSEYARHADVRINAYSGAEIGRLVATGNRSCLIDLKGMKVSDRNKFFVGFAEAYFRHASGERVLVLDEVHNFAPQGKMLSFEATESLHWANRLITEGGGMGITMLSASQRPQKVHKDFVSSNETLIACRVIHKRDRDADKDWVDACGDPDVAKDMLASLAKMPRTDAWVYSPEAEFGPVQITFPMFKTYDSFKPQADRKNTKLKGWAAVDLAEVESKLAKVVEEAKANDPKELRAEIAKLKAEAAKKPKVETITVGDPKAVAAAEARGYARGKIEGYAEGVNEVTATWRDLAGGVVTSIKMATTTLETADKRMQAVLERATKKHVKAATKEAAKKPGSPVVPANTTPAPQRPMASLPPRAPSPAVASGDFSIQPAQQKIIDAIAWAASLGNSNVDRTMVAFLVGVSAKSSGYQNNLGALRGGGLIDYPAGGQVCLTEAGRAAAVPPAQALTHDAVMEKIAEKIPPGQMKILREVSAIFPADIGKDELAERVEKSAASSGYQNDLGALRTFGLLTYPAAKRVRAGEALFP